MPTYFSPFFATDDDLGGKRREGQNVKRNSIGFRFGELKFLEDVISTITLCEESANFCCKEPESKCLGPCGPWSLCCDGVQDILPQKRAPWHIKYFKPKEF